MHYRSGDSGVFVLCLVLAHATFCKWYKFEELEFELLELLNISRNLRRSEVKIMQVENKM